MKFENLEVRAVKTAMLLVFLAFVCHVAIHEIAYLLTH